MNHSSTMCRLYWKPTGRKKKDLQKEPLEERSLNMSPVKLIVELLFLLLSYFYLLFGLKKTISGTLLDTVNGATFR